MRCTTFNTQAIKYNTTSQVVKALLGGTKKNPTTIHLPTRICPHTYQHLTPNQLCTKEFPVNKYGPKAQEKIHGVMHEFEQGKLKSGSGKKVTNRKQAVAIGISEAREKGYKTPREP